MTKLVTTKQVLLTGCQSYRRKKKKIIIKFVKELSSGQLSQLGSKIIIIIIIIIIKCLLVRLLTIASIRAVPQRPLRWMSKSFFFRKARYFFHTSFLHFCLSVKKISCWKKNAILKV